MTNDYHFIITFQEEHMRIEQLTIRSHTRKNLPSITQLSKTRKSLAPIQMITLRNIQSMRKTGNRTDCNNSKANCELETSKNQQLHGSKKNPSPWPFLHSPVALESR